MLFWCTYRSYFCITGREKRKKKLFFCVCGMVFTDKWFWLKRIRQHTRTQPQEHVKRFSKSFFFVAEIKGDVGFLFMYFVFNLYTTYISSGNVSCRDENNLSDLQKRRKSCEWEIFFSLLVLNKGKRNSWERNRFMLTYKWLEVWMCVWGLKTRTVLEAWPASTLHVIITIFVVCCSISRAMKKSDSHKKLNSTKIFIVNFF